MTVATLTNDKPTLSETERPRSLDNIDPTATKKDSATAPSVKTAAEAQKTTAEAVHPFTVVAIGASAGGLEAITLLLQNLSPTTGMAFIYVQHLSPDHKSMLTPLLSKATAMKVQDIDDMEKMAPNNVYVIPYNKGIEVVDGHIKLTPRSGKSPAISIDILFDSLAETHKADVIGVVLSGSASDGTQGLKAIKHAGGITFAQDDSAKFTSMPHSAIAAGVVDFILSPEEIAQELTAMSAHPLLKHTALKPPLEDGIDDSDPHLKRILQLVFNRKHVDFSHYKMNTIKRRILRRMFIHKIKTLKEYTKELGQNVHEIDLLYQDLLINVTDFFRDAETFAALTTTVLPRLLKSKKGNETLRIWVAACATGEEVYSIAMLLFDLQKDQELPVSFQIFASDLSTEAINKARIGEYTLQQLKNVTPKQIATYFTKVKDKYRIIKPLRDICVFAQHNILGDPPFSRMDFISCRNLLIYLDAYAQKKAISTFHYALNEDGCLMLGKSETIGGATSLFSMLNKKYKIYSRKKTVGVNRLLDITPRKIELTLLNKEPTKMTKKTPPPAYSNLGNALDAALLAHYMPASVVINYELDILQFRGNTAPYLQHSTGRATFNILKMAYSEMIFELRNAIHHTIKTKQMVRKAGIEMNQDKVANTLLLVNLEVTPLTIEGEEPLLLVVFTSHQTDVLEAPNTEGGPHSVAKDRRIKKLEEELAAARFDMGSIADDQEASNEELQSINEEIVSSNEELQSLNEELETSKEEIESTNEELVTSNQELNARIQEIEELHRYNEAILTAVHEPMLILDKNMRIKSANKAFCRIFRVTEAESIGTSLYKLDNNQWNIPQLRELLEDILPQDTPFQDFEVNHNFPFIGQKSMLLNAQRIFQYPQQEELIVLTISDVTEVKRLAVELQIKEKKALKAQLEAEKKAFKLLEESNNRYNRMLMQSPFAFAVLKAEDMIIKLANDSVKKIWGKGNEIEDKSIFDVLPEIRSSIVSKMLNDVYTTGKPLEGYELLVPLLRNGKMEDAYFNFVYQPYYETNDMISGVTIIAYEVTPHVVTKLELIAAKQNAEHKTQIAEEAVKAKQQFLSNMSHEIRTPMNAIVGFTHVVLKTDLTPIQKEYINAIKVSGDALIILINDILDLAKVDAGKMTFEQIPFNLSEAIATMMQLFEPKIKEKNVLFIKEYDAAIPKMLIGDPMRLRQIILNLMSNAVKFTEGGRIEMHIKLLKAETDTTTVQFTFTDTGIGISESKLVHIFNNFEQAGSGISTSYGGTGLGLAIVKQLVELQGGTISVKSKLGEGSTFSFSLSFPHTDATEAEQTCAECERTKKDSFEKTGIENVKVLVAEDVALNQLLIKIIIADFGFEIDVVENGQLAIEKLKTNVYNIVLMDLQMPVMNGFEATAYIRQTLKLDIPIIALTADVTTMDVEKCLAIGMNDYISKPIDENLLYNKMVAYLGK